LADVVFETDTLPFSDINVSQLNRYLGTTPTDDARYLQSLSAKDAHAYTPACLPVRTGHIGLSTAEITGATGRRLRRS